MKLNIVLLMSSKVQHNIFYFSCNLSVQRIIIHNIHLFTYIRHLHGPRPDPWNEDKLSKGLDQQNKTNFFNGRSVAIKK